MSISCLFSKMAGKGTIVVMDTFLNLSGHELRTKAGKRKCLMGIDGTDCYCKCEVVESLACFNVSENQFIQTRNPVSGTAHCTRANWMGKSERTMTYQKNIYLQSLALYGSLLQDGFPGGYWPLQLRLSLTKPTVRTYIPWLSTLAMEWSSIA